MHSLPPHPIPRGHEEPVLVPLGAPTRLPPRGAQVAELVSAPARHVVAPVRELDEVAAARAAFPALLRGEVQDLAVVCRVAGPEAVVGLFALPACASETARAVVRSRGARGGPQECGASWTVTVDAIRCAEFESLLFKRPCDGLAEIATNVAQDERLLAAARGEQ